VLVVLPAQGLPHCRLAGTLVKRGVNGGGR
jgi:hypothetical protein